MKSVVLRVPAVLATVLGIAAGASRASAQTGPHVMRPLCTADLAVRVAAPAAGDDGLIVIVSRTAGAPCVVANYPQLAVAGAVPRTLLPTGRLSIAQNAAVGNGAVAAFALRFSTTPPPPSPSPPGPATDGTCPLTVLIANAAVKGPPVVLPVPCSTLAAVAVSSFASGTAPPGDALAPGSPNPPPLACRQQDLALRDVGPDARAGAPGERYALQNVGLAACRLGSMVGAVLRDAKGVPIPLKVAPRAMIAMLIPLQRGHEGSFTLTYPGNGGPNGEQRCVAAATIAVSLPAVAAPLIAETHIVPCPPATGPGLHISNVQAGVPLPVP